MKKSSDTIGQIVGTDKLTKAAARQVGDTKVGKDGVTRYWTQLSSGKFDWRKKKPKGGGGASSGGDGKAAKLKKHLATADEASLTKYAKGDMNDPLLRQFAYDELERRGVDVSDIDLNTGRTKTMKETFGDDDDDTAGSGTPTAIDGLPDDDDDGSKDWRNPDFIKKKFGGLKTKKLRIAADAYIHNQKIKEDSYKPPQKEIYALNKAYAQFLDTDSPLMIASGGAGVGKSFNLHAVAKAMGKKPFDGETDEPGDGDYDYVEAPEVKSDTQLVMLLQEHNGKTIVFDDSDNVLKEPSTMGIMKKATASSGKRIVGKKSGNKSSDVPPFEFTGKILFLTNMNQADLTKNEHLNAIYSRALKKDLNFTKMEKLEMIEKLKHKMNFTGIDRLDTPAEDNQEREEVFDIIKDNIAKIDPDKFNSRTFKEALEIKRGIDGANKMIEDDPVTNKMLFGDIEDWEPEVENFLVKGLTPDENNLEKALSHFNLL
jgi:hypothetical protein